MALYDVLPPAKHLTPKLIELGALAADLRTRLFDANAAHTDAISEARITSALNADTAVQSSVILAGGRASDIGSPESDKLKKLTSDLAAEIAALTEALLNTEVAMCDEFAIILTDDKKSGRTAVAAAEAKFKKAAEALVVAHGEVELAKALPLYFEGTQAGHGGRPYAYEVPALRPGAVRRYRDAVAAFTGLDLA